MGWPSRGLLVGVLLALAPNAGWAQTAPPAASADMHDAAGRSIATAMFSQAPDEVHISISFKDRTALVGTHAIQIHSVAQCDPPSFTSAGPIFNPTGKEHGLLNPNGPMAGDLPNLVIGPAGVAVYNLSAPLVTLGQGAANSLLGGRGTALVIFAQPDDDTTQPEGNAGQRIACGPIVAGTGAGGATFGSAAAADGQSQVTSTVLIAGLGVLLIIGGIMLRRQA